MRTEKPPESWLYKAWDGDVLVDVIFRPVGQEVDQDLFDRAEELGSQRRADDMSPEDVLVTKLLPLDEHELDYERHIEFARALREHVDWQRSANAQRTRPTRERSSRSSRSSGSSNASADDFGLGGDQKTSPEARNG